jgi:hypothetical protein
MTLFPLWEKMRAVEALYTSIIFFLATGCSDLLMYLQPVFVFERYFIIKYDMLLENDDYQFLPSSINAPTTG